MSKMSPSLHRLMPHLLSMLFCSDHHDEAKKEEEEEEEEEKKPISMNKTKYLILTTTNEDFIRKLRSTIENPTEIIDFDSNSLDVRSLSFDVDHPINLSLFAQFTNLTKTDGQIYRQVLQRTKTKSSTDLKCSICDDRAIGFNYDVLSCASCKAFFRRNAHQNIKNLRCLSVNGHGKCSIDKSIRRKCQKCRLEKCLSLGMKKEYLQNEEEKQMRRNRSKTNSKMNFEENILDEIDQLMMDFDNEEKKETNDLIDDISLKYVETFSHRSENECQFNGENLNEAFDGWFRSANDIGISMIYFLRQIEDFESLHFDDRFILIKWNLFLLFPLLKSFFSRSTWETCPFNRLDDLDQQKKFQLVFGDLISLRGNFVQLINSLIRLTKQNPTILSLLSLILIFSKGFSPITDDLQYQNASRIDQLQSFYLNLLSIYLIQQFGHEQTSKFYIEILRILFRIQTNVFQFKHFLQQKVAVLDSTDSLTPLLQTILTIS